MNDCDIGIFGLGVMGRNLALNLEEHGNRVSLFNRKVAGEESLVSDFLANQEGDKTFYEAASVSDFVKSLKTPRKILLLIKAGKPVDMVIDEISQYLSDGDIIIDSGNSHFNDTARREKQLLKSGILFVGMGISGGEEGARNGPSLMPGGNLKAWSQIQPLLEPISARDFNGSPCCAWMGSGGAGHFVKMVHNGIEYADMQLLAESYHFMKQGLGLSHREMARIFDTWSRSELGGFLLEITSKIMTKTDDNDNFILDLIVDSAGQKGTGRWTSITATELGIPLPCISQAVFSRFSSSFTELRQLLSSASQKSEAPVYSPDNEIIRDLESAILASRMMAYAEGFHMIQVAGDHYNWDIDLSSISRIWQGGCIIRSVLLKKISSGFSKNPSLQHLLLDETYSSILKTLQSGWRKTLTRAIDSRIPVPVISASASQYDTLLSGKLPANLIQAQRDFFGAHTYERVDRPRGTFHHTNW